MKRQEYRLQKKTWECYFPLYCALGEISGLTLFQASREITAKDVGELFGYKPRTAALLCRRWAANGFLETTDPAKKSRRYELDETYASIVDEAE